jgi:hypothetical protein
MQASPGRGDPDVNSGTLEGGTDERPAQPTESAASVSTTEARSARESRRTGERRKVLRRLCEG